MPGPAHDRMPVRGPLEDLDVAALDYANRCAAAGAGEWADLRDDFIRRCLPFARRLARRYRGRGEPAEDLEQVARLGLVKAIDRYVPAKGSFTAYAVLTISGELKKHFRDRTWGVHVPRRVQDLSLAATQATSDLTAELARTPTLAEVTGRLGASERGTIEALKLRSNAGYSPVSLNSPVALGDGGAELGDFLEAEDQDLEQVDDRITLAWLLRQLPVRERRMLVLRFYGNRTQAQIAAELGISQMHVSRLLARSLSWLRGAMLSDAPPHWERSDAMPDNHHLDVTIGREGDALTVRACGEVDRDSAARFRAALLRAIAARPPRAVVDLSEVPLVDAAGVTALLDAAAAADAAAVGLHLTAAKPYVTHILRLSGLAGLLVSETGGIRRSNGHRPRRSS